MSYKGLTSDIYCDLCRKKIILWNPFNKTIRCVVRLKEHIWYEYYHMKCLIKAGKIRKLKKEKAGRWDTDEDPGTGNLVH